MASGFRRFAVTVVLSLAAAVVHAQSCETRSFGNVSYTGAGCSGGSLTPGVPNSFCDTASDVTFTATASAPFQGCETFTWTFGDGTPAVTGSSPSITHRYDHAGSFSANARINSGGGASSRSFLVYAGVGLFSVVVPAQPIPEGAVSQIEVRRSSGTGAASVQYSTSGGSPGRDYTPASGTLSFADGETSKTIALQTLHNNIHADGAPHVFIKLDNPSSGWFTFGGTITIAEIDPPAMLTFEQPSYTVTEGSALQVTVKRAGDLLNTEEFSLSFDSDHPFLERSFLTLFQPNETSKTVTLTPPNDDLYNGPKNVKVFLVPFTEFDTGDPTSVTILDDDTPIGVSIDGDVSVVEGDSDTTDAVFTLRLSRSASVPVTVNYKVTPLEADNFDYGPYHDLAEVLAGQTTGTLPIPVRGDVDYEPDERFRVTISSSSPSVRIDRGTAIATIVNDDARVTPATQIVAVTGTATYTVDLPHAPQPGDVLTLSGFDATVVSAPATVPLDPARSSITFDVHGLKKGTTTVRATLPPSFGGTKSVTADVTVIDPVTIKVSPSTIAMAVNDAREIMVELSPLVAAEVPVTLSKSDGAAISAPPAITIGANSLSRFHVSLRKRTPATLTFSIPPRYAAADATLQLTPTDSPEMGLLYVTPPFGPAAGKTEVRIDGWGFVAPCSVSFGSASTTNVNVMSPTVLTATLPAHAAGAAQPKVTCGSRAVSGGQFTYLSDTPPPAIYPLVGSELGGTLVRITNADLTAGCGISFGNLTAHGVITETPTTVLAITPKHGTGFGSGFIDVVLHCPNRTTTMPSAFFYTDQDAPQQVLTLNSGSGVPGQEVTIQGSFFNSKDAVYFGDTRASVISSAPDQKVVVVPDVTPALLRVAVVTPSQRSLSPGYFTVLDPLPPHIDSIAPSSGPAGTEIVINGGGFRPNHIFALGDRPATLVSLDFGRAVVRVPDATPAGSYLVNILTAASGPPFAVTSGGPAITAITPGCATTSGGTQIVIRGSGFAAGATVSVNDNAATSVTVVDATMIRATLPAGAMGDARVTVRNPDSATASMSNALHYVSPYDADGGCAPRTRLTR